VYITKDRLQAQRLAVLWIPLDGHRTSTVSLQKVRGKVILQKLRDSCTIGAYTTLTTAMAGLHVRINSPECNDKTNLGLLNGKTHMFHHDDIMAQHMKAQKSQ
jgi:hypothetical protein